MAVNAGRAEAHLDLNYSKFKEGMAKAKGDAKEFANEIKSLGKGGKGFMDDLGGSITKMGSKFGGAGGLATAMFAIIKGGFKLGVASTKEFTNDLKIAGTVGATAMTVVAGGIALACKEGIAFESKMAEVKAITGANDTEFKKLTVTARDWGSKTRYSATEVASAMQYMGMAGWNTSQIVEGMSGVLNLATVGNVDLARASDIVTDGLTAMGLSAKDASDFADMMSATITRSNTSVELMGETMKYVAPVAGSLGIEMEDLSVAIGLMANSGIKGSQSGTALRSGLTNLVKPTKQMKEAMSKYGIEIQKNDDGSINLANTITHLRDKLGKLDAATQAQTIATIFGKEAMSGWSAIINANEQDLLTLTSEINNSTKAMQFWKKHMEDAGMSAEEVEKNLTSLDAVFEECKLTSDALGLSSEDLALAITLLGKDSKVSSDDVNRLLDSLIRLNDPTKQATQAMEKYGIEIQRNEDRSVNFAGTLENLRGALQGKTEEQQRAILADIGLQGSANEIIEVLKLSDAEFQNYKNELEQTKGLTEKLAETMDATTEGALKSMASAISDLLIEAFEMVKPYVQEFANSIGELANTLKNEGVSAAVDLMCQKVREKLKDLPQAMRDSITWLSNAVIENFPKLMSLGSEIVISLCNGIINNQQSIASAVSTMTESIANFIIEATPYLGEAGKSILDAVMTAFRENRAIIGEAVATFVSTATEYFLAKKAMFIEVGIDIAGSIVVGAIQGLNNKISEWTGGVSDFLLNPFKVFSGEAADEAMRTGKMLADKAGEGVDTSKMNFSEKVSGFMKYGFNWKQQYAEEAKKIGKGSVKGVEDGVEQGKLGIDKKVNDTVVGALDKNKASTKQKGNEVGKGAAKGVEEGASEMSPAMAKELQATTKALQQGATDMYNGAKVSFTRLSEVAKTSMTDMYKGVSTSFHNMANKCKQSASDMYNGTSKSFRAAAQGAKAAMSDMYNGVTTSSSRMASKVIADWNRIRSSLRGTITGNVQIKVHGVQAALNQINSIKNQARRSAMPVTMLRTFDTNNNFARVMRYKQDMQSYVNKNTSTGNKDNELRIKVESNVSKKEAKRIEKAEINVNLNIQNFNNEREEDVNSLMDRIAYELEQKNIIFG